MPLQSTIEHWILSITVINPKGLKSKFQYPTCSNVNHDSSTEPCTTEKELKRNDSGKSAHTGQIHSSSPLKN